MSGPRRRRSLGVLAVLAAGVILIGYWVLVGGGAPNGTNFHVVVPEAVFRSAQLSAAELESVIRRHGIRAVVNLRGSQPGEPWYEAEVAVAERLGVRHVDLQLFADRQPPRQAVARLIELLETSPRPLLIHCDAGADRAGLASAVARIVLEGASLAEARQQLDIAFGHVPFGPSGELDRFFDRYERHLEETRQPHRAVTFKTWATELYTPYAYNAAIEAVEFPARAVAYVAFEAGFRVVNLSPETWVPWDPRRGTGIRLGFFVRPAGADDWSVYRHRLDFERPVEPGEAAEARGLFFTPAVPGTYEVKVDLIDETVAWFEDQGSTPLVMPLVVEARRGAR